MTSLFIPLPHLPNLLSIRNNVSQRSLSNNGKKPLKNHNNTKTVLGSSNFDHYLVCALNRHCKISLLCPFQTQFLVNFIYKLFICEP